MASSISLTTNYVGKFINELFSAEIFKTDSLSYVSVLPNLKGNTGFLPRVEVNNFLKPASCEFDATGTVSLTEKEVNAKSIGINLSLCITDLENSWYNMGWRPGANNNDIPADLQTYTVNHVAMATIANIEEWFWGGVTDPSAATPTGLAEFDGIYTLAVADGGVDVSGTTITSSNVIAELNKVLAEAAVNAPAVYTKKEAAPSKFKDAKIYVPLNVLAAYEEAVAALGVNSYYNSGDELNFKGFKLIVTNGLADNKIVFGSPSNLWLVTDLMSDANELKLIDMRNTTGDDTVRVIGKMLFGAAYRVRSELVIYG